MKNIFKYLKKYKLQCILSPAFKLFEVVLELSVPFIISYMIDYGIGGDDKPLIIKLSLLLCGFALLGLGFAVVAQYFAAKAATGFAKDLRSAVFSHISKLSYKDLDGFGTSSLITNMTSDIQRIQTGVNLTLRLLLRSPLVVLGAVIACFFIDAGPASKFAFSVPFLLIFVYIIMLFGMRAYSSVQEKLSKTVLRAKENLLGVRVIRAFGAENGEKAEFRTQNAALLNKQLSSGRITALLNPVTFVIVNIAVVALMYSGAIKVDGGFLSKGEIVAMYNLTAMVLVELIKLADLTINITKALSSAKRISAVLDTVPSVTYGTIENKTDYDNAVCFENVSLSYGGGNALENINVTIKTGSVFGVIGGTGSGKTSFVSLISRFYDATGGAVKLFGTDVKDYSEKALRSTVSAAPQRAVLFEGTARDNMKFGMPSATDEQINEALKVACAYDFVYEKGGLDCRVEALGKNFSGGQKQRLCVARAVLRGADILILDDSSSALDFATDAQLRQNLASLDKSLTVIIAAQRISSVSGADKILVLCDGKAAGLGSHEELLQNCEEYRRIYASQNGEGEDE